MEYHDYLFKIYKSEVFEFEQKNGNIMTEDDFKFYKINYCFDRNLKHK
jgi:hypothetical protein